MTTLGISGRNGWGRMKATDAEVAGQLRQFLLSGKVSSATLADNADRDRQVLGLVGARFPKAVALLGRPSILALARTLGGGTCSWCAAAMIAAGDQEPAPDLDSAAQRALLGSPCARCQRHHAAAKVADRERGHVGEVLDAGLNLAAAGRLRSSAEIRRQAEGIRRLREARPAPAPTGVLSTGPEPASVRRAVTAALGPLAPSY